MIFDVRRRLQAEHTGRIILAELQIHGVQFAGLTEMPDV